MKLKSLGLASTLLLLFSTFSAIAFGTTHESLCTFADGPFVRGTTAQDSPLKSTPESFYPSTVDIIDPQPGQFANYSYSLEYLNGTGWSGWWNVSYNEYVQPHVINTTHVIVIPAFNGTFWCTVDKTNRWVTNTDPNFWWNQTWYILWIETNVTVGSTINWWVYNATIVGSQTLYVAGKYIDSWILFTPMGEIVAYDKVSGVMVAYHLYVVGEGYVDLILETTNIPIGGKLSTSVYFDLNPNPASVGETVTLKGILVDQFSWPLAGETVRLYARPLAGSWRYITSLTTNTFGIFTWQVEIPVAGTFIFAAYYPRSEMYESTYNLAILIVQ